MIISRAKAEQAAKVLHVMLENLTPELLKSAFRDQARETHPDTGGSQEEFAQVDWAKHVLEHWLKQPASTATGQARNDCPNCYGKGYMQRYHGFKLGPRVQCARCVGTGDVDYVSDTGKGDSL